MGDLKIKSREYCLVIINSLQRFSLSKKVDIYEVALKELKLRFKVLEIDQVEDKIERDHAIKLIQNAKLIISDITKPQPFEIIQGKTSPQSQSSDLDNFTFVAIALQKSLILVHEKQAEIPQTSINENLLPYDQRNPFWGTKLVTDLIAAIKDSHSIQTKD